MKVALVLLIALTTGALLRRRSAAVRHWLLAAAILCAAALPVAERLLPSWSVPMAAPAIMRLPARGSEDPLGRGSETR